jgi:lysophospholipase L1-like esterase
VSARRVASAVLILGVLVSVLVSGCTRTPSGGPATPASATPASATPASASPAGSGTATASGNYLALGDSVVFGYRPPKVTPIEDYLQPSRFTGYPSDLARALGLTVVNASCPGETTASMISTSAPSYGCENAQGSSVAYRTLAPLHVSYQGSQLSFAVHFLEQHRAARLVTLTIGANDLFRCQNTTADHCTGSDFRRELAQVSANLDTILATLRAHYRGNLIMLTYYALDYRDPGQTEQLNAVLTAQARRYKARIASGFAAFAPAADREGGDTCATGLLIKLPGGSCDEHPSAAGQALLAKAIERIL